MDTAEINSIHINTSTPGRRMAGLAVVQFASDALALYTRGGYEPDSERVLKGTTNCDVVLYDMTFLNLLYTISALSNSTPVLRICRAIKEASTNTGGFFPTSEKPSRMFLRNLRWRIVRTLSPIHTMLVVELAGRSAMVVRMALKMLEWIPPQRPLSEDTAMMRWFGLRSSDRTSDLSNSAVWEGGRGGGGGVGGGRGEEACRGGGRSVHGGREGGCMWEGMHM